MTLRDASGNILSKAELTALTTTSTVTSRTLTADIYEDFSYSGEMEGKFQQGKRRKFKAGTVLTQAQFDALFVLATVTSISPATGPAAGNTLLTITGTNLDGVEGVLVGGVAATDVKVLSKTKVTCKTPAHAAGAVSVVTKDDYADVTSAAAFTYA